MKETFHNNKSVDAHGNKITTTKGTLIIFRWGN